MGARKTSLTGTAGAYRPQGTNGSVAAGTDGEADDGGDASEHEALEGPEGMPEEGGSAESPEVSR